MFKLTVTAALIAAATAVSVTTINQLVAVQPSFESFKGQFGKAYNSDNEHAKRAAIYASNVEFMDAHNANFASGEATFDMGVNEFSDLSQLVSLLLWRWRWRRLPPQLPYLWRGANHGFYSLCLKNSSCDR
jgi:hypothetical protein